MVEPILGGSSAFEWRLLFPNTFPLLVFLFTYCFMFLQGLKGFPGVKGERVSNSHLIYTVPRRKPPLWRAFRGSSPQC